jgi:uncharacterized protein
MPTTAPFHLMAKPGGSICNLGCRYCYYLEKENFYPAGRRPDMDDATLEAFIRSYIEAQPGGEVHFAWQGGEPTLRGLDFFRRAVALQQRHAGGRVIHNALQTNGVLIDADWAAFLADHDFLVGISIDGPAALHDALRVSAGGQPTHARVLSGLEHLQSSGVRVNILTTINARNAAHGPAVYGHLLGLGARHIQFIPIVERRPDARARRDGLDFAGPPPLDGTANESPAVSPHSVQPLAFGRFLTAIFDQWVRRDVGTVFVNYFDNALAAWSGVEPAMCVFRETCGDALVIEHDGTIYSCDHFVYPEYALGNIQRDPLAALVDSPRQRAFGAAKSATLPDYCRRCDVRFACNGECPKHRFARTPDGAPGLNYLCPGLKHFFHHVDPYMRMMAELLRRRQPPAAIMEILRRQGAPPARR